jgi:uncharacterized protein (TIGR04255 family)
MSKEVVRVMEAKLAGLNLPDADRVLFDRAPLVLTIAQVRYPALIRFGEQSSLARLQDELAKDYPNASPEQQVSVAINVGGIQQQQGGPNLWRFSTLDGTWSVVVGQDAVTIESRAYEEISHFCNRIRRVLKAVEKTLRPTHQRRLGLRYINEFRYEDGATMGTWNSLLNQDLLGLSGRLGESVDHSFHEIRARTEYGVLLIHHGLFRGASTNRIGESSGNDPFYLLDLDYYDDTPGDWDVERVLQRMSDWNDIMYRLFRWSMTERLFQHLGPRYD